MVSPCHPRSVACPQPQDIGPALLPDTQPLPPLPLSPGAHLVPFLLWTHLQSQLKVLPLTAESHTLTLEPKSFRSHSSTPLKIKVHGELFRLPYLLSLTQRDLKSGVTDHSQLDSESWPFPPMATAPRPAYLATGPCLSFTSSSTQHSSRLKSHTPQPCRGAHSGLRALAVATSMPVWPLQPSMPCPIQPIVSPTSSDISETKALCKQMARRPPEVSLLVSTGKTLKEGSGVPSWRCPPRPIDPVMGPQENTFSTSKSHYHLLPHTARPPH